MFASRKDPSEYNGEEPHTPWIWSPPSLLESGDRATPTRDFNSRRTGSVDTSLQTASTPTRDHSWSSRGSFQESSSAQAHTQTPERSSSRANYFYGIQESSATPTGPARHSSDPSDLRPTQSTSTSSQRSIGQADSWPNRTRSQPPAANEVPPYPAPTPTILHRSASAQQTMFTQEPETFTSRGDLQPTFSSNIIRTPTHYQVRRSTDELPSSYHSRSPSSAGHSSTSSRGPPVPEPVTRQSSLPNAISSTRDVYTNFSEDMSNSLNASTSSRTRSSANTLSRSRTEPVIPNLGTIHESSSALSSGEIFLAPLRDTPTTSSTESSPDPSPHRRARRTSPYNSVPHSPEPSPGLYRDRRPSPYASRHADPHSHSHSPSPLASPHAHVRDPYGVQGGNSNSAPRRDSSNNNNNNNNPLPAPPVERSNLEASRPPVQEASPPHYTRKVRMGFWNRRGDHLTPNSFVVYAPHDRAYPEELRDYPDERDGYRDQFGMVVAWREERPELPTSLPYHGRPPTQPYESVRPFSLVHVWILTMPV